MAVKIRCSSCRKKIAVDEAFAGGMCRCPYCKTIMTVPASAASGGGTRVGRPVRPDRPQRPQGNGRGSRPGGSGLDNITGSRPIISGDVASQPNAHNGSSADTAAAESKTAKVIPTASPVRLQGMVTLVLLGVLAVVLFGCVYLVLQMLDAKPTDGDGVYRNGPPPAPPARRELANPFTIADAPGVCGDVPIEAPVAYCIDAGGKMGQDYFFARHVAQASAESLPGGAKVTTVVATDPDIKTSTARGKDLENALGEAVESDIGSGAPELDEAIIAALQTEPKTLVLIVSKKTPDAEALLAKVKQQQASLVLVVLGAESWEDKKALEAFGEANPEARVCVYDLNKLPDLAREAGILE